MNKKKIYIFGNELMEIDNQPVKMLTALKKLFPEIDFILVDPNEDFPPQQEKDLIIIDTIINIRQPIILNLDNFDKVRLTPISPHDYDLLMHLLLLKKMHKINTVKIIGIPPDNFLKHMRTVTRLIKNIIYKDSR